jgi:hypothetical protein
MLEACSEKPPEYSTSSNAFSQLCSDVWLAKYPSGRDFDQLHRCIGLSKLEDLSMLEINHAERHG